MKGQAVQNANDRGATGHEFTELWHRYQRPLTYFVSSLLRSGVTGDAAAEAEDAVQEIMLKVYRSLERYDGRRSMSAWVYTIARNHCADLRRKRRVLRMPLDQDDEGVEALAGERYRTPEQAYLAEELRRSIDSFMATLGPEDRTVLFLRFYEELPYGEIAAVTGRPEGTVRYRVHELKRHLRDYLEGHA